MKSSVKNNLKHRIEQAEDYLDDHLENITNLTQLVLTGIMFLCVIAGGIAHLVMENLSLIGILVVALLSISFGRCAKLCGLSINRIKSKNYDNPRFLRQISNL